jgi:zinc transport system substrate-binding protein
MEEVRAGWRPFVVHQRAILTIILNNPQDGTVKLHRTAARAVAVAATAALLSVTITACGTDADGADDGRVQVLASFYPLQFVAEQVAGDLADVGNLTPPAADPHEMELSPARAREISTADVVVTLHGFQPAVDEAIEARAPQHVVDAADIVTLLSAEVTGGSAEHDHEHADEEDHADEEEHEDHGLGGLDPHFWLDPTKLAELAKPVADALSAADPEHAATYAANASALVDRLNTLDADFAQGLAPFEGATLVTNHTAFGYLANRYGLEQVGVTGLDHDTEASPARLREIGDIVRTHGVTTLFTESLISPKMMETLASDLGVATAQLDTLEGLDADKAANGEDYVSIMRSNLTTLTQGLTAK